MLVGLRVWKGKADDRNGTIVRKTEDENVLLLYPGGNEHSVLANFHATSAADDR